MVKVRQRDALDVLVEVWVRIGRLQHILSRVPSLFNAMPMTSSLSFPISSNWIRQVCMLLKYVRASDSFDVTNPSKYLMSQRFLVSGKTGKTSTCPGMFASDNCLSNTTNASPAARAGSMTTLTFPARQHEKQNFFCAPLSRGSSHQSVS